MTPPRNERWRRLGQAAVPWASGLFGAMIAANVSEQPGRLTAALIVLLLTIIQVAALMRRHRQPVASFVVVATCAAAVQLLSPDAVLSPALLFSLGSLTIARPLGRSIPALVAASAVSAVTLTIIPAEDTVFAITLQVAVWSLGQAIRSTRAASREEALRAVAEERAHLEREVHDILAHSLSVMIVQAAAADDAFDIRPDAARAALRTIEEQGREALGEIRRLLAPPAPALAIDTPPSGNPPRAASGDHGDYGVHGADGAPVDTERSPQPGLADLPRLAERLASAGAELVVEHHGQRRPLAAGLELSAYRIIQEATTNSLRHGGASRIGVDLHHQPDGLACRISDNGRPPARGSSPGPTGGGRGMVGMRERARLHGGTLTAGPGPAGGYLVEAWLPAALTPAA